MILHDCKLYEPPNGTSGGTDSMCSSTRPVRRTSRLNGSTICKKNNANASGTADRWKAAFFRMYQLEFRDFHLPLLSAPTEVVKVCNILANILLVKPWKLIIGLHKTTRSPLKLCA